MTSPADSDGAANAVNENAANGTVVGLTAAASDADATTNGITYALFDDAGGRFAIDAATGVVTVADGSLLNREAATSHDITVRASSQDGSTADSSFTIAINDLNDNSPIVGLGQSFSVSEFATNGTSLGIAVASDVDTVGSIQNWMITSGNSDGIFEIDAATGEIRVFDNTLLNFETTASYLLGLTVEDGQNTSTDQTVLVSIVDENDVPVLAANLGVSVVEGANVMISSAELSVIDEDELPGQILFSVVSSPVAGRLEMVADPGTSINSFTQDDINTGRLRYVHDGSEADDSFTFTVSDGSGGMIATTTFSITNLRVNDAPVNTVPPLQMVNEDSPLVFSSTNGNSISVNDVDLNGELIGVRLVADKGTLTLASTAGLVFASGDGSNDTSMVFAGSISDVNAALDGLRFDPTANYNGPASVRIVARDMGSSGSGGEQSDDDTINITVEPVNDTPVAADDFFSTDEDSSLMISTGSGLVANDFDIDGDVLSVIAVSSTANGTLSLNTDGSFVYTPNTNFNGVDSFTYRASDGSLQSEIRTVTLTVNAVNDAPVSNDESFVMPQLTILKLTAADGVLINDVDVEADTLRAILVDSPRNGTLVLNADGSFTYTPAPTFFGEDSFTYRSNDGSLNGSIATVRIVVQQTVTSGTTNTSGGGVTTDDTSNSDGTAGANIRTVVLVISVEPGGNGFVVSSSDNLLSTPQANDSSSDSTMATDTATDNVDSSAGDSQDARAISEMSFAIDDRGELRDRMTGRIVEDAGVVVFTSTDVGSMVYVLGQSGFWSQLDNFQQDVQHSMIQEGEWETLVVETTTVAGTTLTVGYIVWLLRSGSVVFGLISSLPAWTMMDPLPILESGLANLTDGEAIDDDDSLQGILQAHRDGLEPIEESFEN